ncbi:unnamed protein product [Cyprideis torosa]|uniref:non-specific serine/threonine protein kinase n=1 Tax=Cyprideis torosa TaxID=163714 RepID=A0A7R8WHX2_9CRUS|nr:unnamed protein product [Cyprideis torosa]CAG0899969.1 unnamed protein product [Cyprideis torosa]
MKTEPLHCMNKSDPLYFLPHTDDRVTPLHYAATLGHTSSVTCLLEMGAPVDATEKDKWRPLHFACGGGHTPCVELLLSAGADINARDRVGRVPLHHCIMEGHRSVVLLLLGRGAEVDRRDEIGMTPLLWACMQGHVSIARDLVAHGADVNASERRGETPLIKASERGHVEMVEYLVTETNVDLEARDMFGRTALASAAMENLLQVMKALLAAGAEVDAVLSNGFTPLKYACKWGSLEGVRLLVDHGADWTLTDDYGVSTVWQALRREDSNLREYFMGLCGREFHQLAQVKPTTLPDRLKTEFTEIQDIGQGSFGTVVKAEKDGKAYAVKQVDDLDSSASTAEQGDELPWQQEELMMTIGSLSPFICGLIRTWRQEKSTFFQMQLCESDLHDWMSRKKPKNRKRKEVLQFLCDCSSGLRFLHDGIKKIHRDIKPPNIFLGRGTDVVGITRLVAKIGDLGLATDRFNPKGEFYFERSQGGGAGVYLAPEIKGIALKTENNPVVHGVPRYDEKIDIYSMGAVFFDLLFLEPEAGHSECRWTIYKEFQSAYPDYYPLIRRMLGGKEEKHERPPAYEVEDEAHRWLQEWLQTEGAAEDDRESVQGEEDGEKEKQGNEKENRERNKMAAPSMTAYEKLKKREAMKEEELKRRRIEEKELERKEMALITCEIGEGGYGKVYKAMKKADREEYALKCVTISGDSEKMQRSLREVRSAMQHGGSGKIVKCYDAWIEEGDDRHGEKVKKTECSTTFAEFKKRQEIEEENDQLQEWGQGSQEVTKKTLEGNQGAKRQGAHQEHFGAVKFMHENGYIHRDLKPQNILLSGDARTVKLADLGIAVQLQERNVETGTRTARRGTRFYAAPEQYNSLPGFEEPSYYGGEVDVYALGVILVDIMLPLSPPQ